MLSQTLVKLSLTDSPYLSYILFYLFHEANAVENIFDLIKPHKIKLQGVKSEECASQAIVPSSQSGCLDTFCSNKLKTGLNSAEEHPSAERHSLLAAT